MKSMPLVAEIIGPSGAGKSTLSGALNAGGWKVRAGITVWGLPLFLLAASMFLSLPTLFFLFAERRRFRPEEIKQVIRLNAFYQKLKKEIEMKTTPDYTALFLDEGIVFALAKLRADSIGDKKKPVRFMRKWEESELDRWSEILDAVVWLDAPDELLIERIRGRAKWHRMKYKPDGEVQEFLARYRDSYERIIYELKSRRNDIEIVRFRTDRASLDKMAKEIFQLVNAADERNLQTLA